MEWYSIDSHYTAALKLHFKEWIYISERFFLCVWVSTTPIKYETIKTTFPDNVQGKQRTDNIY